MEPTTVTAQDDSISDAAVNDYFEDLDLLIRKFETFFGRMLSVSWRNFAYIQSYLHRNTSEFTVEACATKENRGPCVYKAGFDFHIDGLRNCSMYTIGECDEEIKM